MTFAEKTTDAELPQTADEALAVFKSQLVDRVGAKTAAHMTCFCDYNAETAPQRNGIRCVVGIMSGPHQFGHPITSAGPRPDFVLTNCPLPIDEILSRYYANQKVFAR